MDRRPYIEENSVISKIESFIGGSLKAHAAGLGAAFALLVADLAALKTGSSITVDQWVGIVGAYLGVGAVVHIVPNTPSTEAVIVEEPVDVEPDVAVATGAEGANA